MALSAIVCVALYMVVTPPAPTVKRAESGPQTRTLAYQEKIARSAEETKEVAPEAPAPAPAASQPAASAPAQRAQAPLPPETVTGAPAEAQGGTEMAALPPGEDEPGDPNALPWQRPSPPNAPPGMEAEADAPMPPPPGAYDEPYDPYDPQAGLPEEVDPNGLPAEEPQEWVQVLVSGAGMHGAASDDAPMLFAFPYGRVLRVVSRYEGWVEVTDPQSAATGWMQAHLLAPARPPGPPGVEAFYGEEPREHPSWLRRQGDGFADMINRALGGR
ncbi:MAG: hypothetical protein ABWZ94_04175 [Methyloceanibacter sp.]